MTTENNQQIFSNSKEEKVRVEETSSEKPEKKESLPARIENYLNRLDQLKDISRGDTNEALELLADSQTDPSSDLSLEKSEIISEIKDLDAEKTALIDESEKLLQEEQLGGGIVRLPDLDLEIDSLSSQYSYQIDQLQFEKSNLRHRELKILAAVSYSKIKDHASDLGVEIVGLPEEKISFKNKDGVNAGAYNTDYDDIRVDSNSAHVIIHEELHFAGAVDNRNGQKNLGEKRLSKTGFKSVWQAREGNGKDRDVLRSLNEAVTEKMAREIFNANKESIISDVVKADPDIAELNDKLVEKEKALELSESERYLPEKYKTYQENIFIQEYEMGRQSFEELAAEEKRKIESRCNSQLFAVKSQEMLKESNAYSNEIRVLDAILDKLSQARADEENISPDEAKIKEWQDMQRAYLKGETIYLRRIDKIIGPNILREFNDIDIRKVNGQEETVENYRKKIDDLIERINS